MRLPPVRAFRRRVAPVLLRVAEPGVPRVDTIRDYTREPLEDRNQDGPRERADRDRRNEKPEAAWPAERHHRRYALASRRQTSEAAPNCEGATPELRVRASHHQPS